MSHLNRNSHLTKGFQKNIGTVPILQYYTDNTFGKTKQNLKSLFSKLAVMADSRRAHFRRLLTGANNSAYF
jgi:hypothetical protein